jgi:hypothetical protein
MGADCRSASADFLIFRIDTPGSLTGAAGIDLGLPL